jgi:hypothetical protein
MKAKIALALLSSLLVGCASKTWYHPTASESQFRRESAMCERDASLANPAAPSAYNPYLTPMQQSQAAIAQGSGELGRAFSLKNSFENCMAIKGYVSR